MRRRKKRSSPLKSPASDIEEGLNIPAGISPPERQAYDDLTIEPRALALPGAALASGEVLSTPVRTLFECGAINADEVQAAHLFKYDHEVAFQAKSAVTRATPLKGNITIAAKTKPLNAL